EATWQPYLLRRMGDDPSIRRWNARRITAGLRPLLLRPLDDGEAEFVELLLLHWCRAVHQRVVAAAHLREGDDLADVLVVGQKHNEPVEAGRDASVRRRAELEGVQHVAEAGADLRVRESHLMENS